MKVYLAGVFDSGNIKEFMKVYLASFDSRIFDNDMKIYLAGNDGSIKQNILGSNIDELYFLESYHYISQKKWLIPFVNRFKGFLLDSGAFTFLTSMKNKKIDWDKYVEEYASFVKENDIKHFFELDIDPIVGIKEVERLRNKLENIAGKKCIPVWHKSRGLEYWKKMTSEYNYTAIGGIVTQEIKRKDYDIFIPLLKIAKQNKSNVHGLGFTNMDGIKKYKFYSVDSTSWTSGNRFGHAYFFNGKEMIKQEKKEGQRVKNKEVAVHNFKEWLKFQKYAEQNL